MDLKPKVVISKCINIAPVRYNGEIISDEFARKLGKYVDYIAVCPEVEICLGVPRAPVVLIKNNDGKVKMIEPQKGTNYTEAMEKFANEFLSNLKEVDGFLLKARSPSCGVMDTKLYSTINDEITNGVSGIFATKAMEYFADLPVEDEDRLTDYWIRYNFLTRIFALCDIRTNLVNAKDMREILQLHERYNYLIMLYSQTKLKEMNQLLTNYKTQGFGEVKNKYTKLFKKAIKRQPGLISHYNVLRHIIDHFSDKLSSAEREHIQKTLNMFLKGNIALNDINKLIKELAFQFQEHHLLNQVYLNPFPNELNRNC